LGVGSRELILWQDLVMCRRMALLVVMCLALAAPGPAVSRLPEAAVRAFESIDSADLRAYVGTLASDEFNGRGVGDPGNRAAEEYVCATLKRNGATPAAGDGSCYQPVDVYRPVLGSAAHLTISSEDGHALVDLAIGNDFYPLPETGGVSVTAPVVFAGYGISAPALKHDDYAHVDARGAIVLAKEGGPDTLSRAGLGSTRDKLADARAHGARGLLIVGAYLPEYRSLWPEYTSVRQAAYRLVAPLRATPTAVATLSEHAAAPVLRALAERRRLTATLAPDLVATPVPMRNVLGIVEGRDPRRHDEMVVIGAHLDHDGTDADGQIYNGADDNASGTAAVLAAAGAFARAAANGERPARPVLFALWNGEEKGSLGAEAFVASPEPNRRVVAYLNLDMVGRHEEVPNPDDWRFHGLPKTDPATTGNTLHVLGYSYTPELAAMLRSANDAIGLTLQEDYDRGAQDLLKRSDNWPFLTHGIPALFLTTGLHPDYHTPDDDTARIDFGKLARITRLAARATWIAADGPEPTLKKR
jgi:peptidase M28-like protein